MSQRGIHPSIAAGHMAAPALTHRIDKATHKQGRPFPFHFRKTKKERGLLETLKRQWKQSADAIRWKNKEFITNERMTF